MNYDVGFYVIGAFAVMNFGALVAVAIAGLKLSAKFGETNAKVDRNGRDIQQIFKLMN